MTGKGRRDASTWFCACWFLSCGGNVLDSAGSQGGGGQSGEVNRAGSKDGGGGPSAPLAGNREEEGTLPFLLPERDGGLQSLVPVVGVWVGQSDVPITLAAGWPPSPNPARLVLILKQTDDGVAGTITFGDAPGPSPPTNPDVLFPEGKVANFDFLSWLDMPIEGFEYPLSSVRKDGARVLVQFSPGQLWSQWCALQPTYPYSSDSYACVPPGSETDSSYPTSHPLKSDLCVGWRGPVCHCDIRNCSANLDSVRTVELMPEGSDLVGQTQAVTSTFNAPPAHIRLRRIQ